MKNIFISGNASYNSVITLDEFPAPEPKTIHHCHFKETLGNTGAGKAKTLSQLGFCTTFHSLIGEDAYGEKVTKALEHSNLTFMYDIDPKGTERHVNIMNNKGERISIFINPSTDEPAINYSKFEQPIAKADFVVLNISNYSRNIIPVCQKLKKEIWTDLHDYNLGNTYHQDFINAADYVFLSSDNLKDYHSFMENQINLGKKLVVCTHGKKGATALTPNGEWIEVPIIEDYKMKNTNGAGDAFFSGFIYGFSKEYSILKCMQMGTVVAGLCITSETITAENLSKNLLESEFLKHF